MGLLGKGVNKIGGAAKGLLDEVADMLFIHGTDADKLKLYDAIGGQPMPSLAVTQKDIPFDWGDIDLIGKKGSFSPESNSLNDLYSTDAYTVRSNMPLRKAKEDAGDLFRKRFGNVGHYASELDNSDLASVEIDDYFNGRFGMGPTKFAEEKGIPAVKKPDGSTSHIKTKHFIRDNHGPEYSEWIQEQMDYLFEPEIYRMKLGKMVPYDVEDVTEEMVKKRGIGAEGVFDTTGYSKATEATKFKSLNEAKAARSALMEKSIADTKYNEMDYEGVAPTQYFESKPARSVGFKEYAGAIVPEHVDDKTLKILKDRGLHIEKYATPDERLAARGKFKSEMFTRPVTAAATGLLGLGALAQSDESEAGVVGGILGKSIKTTTERMKDAGLLDFIDDAFHGSTHNIEDYGKAATLNPEGHFGASHYFTSSVDDANEHYAGLGPDLTSRINQRMDELDSQLDGYEADDLMSAYSQMTKTEAEKIAGGDSQLFDDFKRRVATRELAGDNEGAVYPVKLRTGKIFDVDTDKDTFMRYERDLPDRDDLADEIRDEIDLEDYADEDEFESAVEELVDERYYDAMSYEEPQGELADFIYSIRRQSGDYDFDADELIGRIEEEALDGDGITASELDDIMRTSEWWADDDQGRLINNEVYRQAVEDAGFDSIKHKGDIFQGMETEAGTIHTIVFDPKNIRSKHAQFDPAKSESSDILASRIAPTAATGLLGLSALSQSDGAYAAPDMSAFNIAKLAPDDVRAAEIAATDIRDVGSIQAPRSQGAATAANLANRYNRAVQNAGPIGLLAPEAPESLIRKSAYGDKRGLMDYIGAALGML